MIGEYYFMIFNIILVGLKYILIKNTNNFIFLLLSNK